MAVKGQVIPAYDPRGYKGMGSGYATSNRGACHLRAYTSAAEKEQHQSNGNAIHYFAELTLTTTTQPIDSSLFF